MRDAPPRPSEVNVDKPALAGFLVYPVTFTTQRHTLTTSKNGMLFMVKSMISRCLRPSTHPVTFKTVKMSLRVRMCACIGAYARQARNMPVTNVTVTHDDGNTLYMMYLCPSCIPLSYVTLM